MFVSLDVIFGADGWKPQSVIHTHTHEHVHTHTHTHTNIDVGVSLVQACCNIDVGVVCVALVFSVFSNHGTALFVCGSCHPCPYSVFLLLVVLHSICLCSSTPTIYTVNYV